MSDTEQEPGTLAQEEVPTQEENDKEQETNTSDKEESQADEDKEVDTKEDEREDLEDNKQEDTKDEEDTKEDEANDVDAKDEEDNMTDEAKDVVDTTDDYEEVPAPVQNGVHTEDGPEIEAHPAFHGSGQKVGIELWRIEKFEPVKQDEKTYGKFYNGDAYILLSTRVPKGSRKFKYDIHFWLGKKCAQDESGTAAIRTVELDEHLGVDAVQHREVQSHESKLFLSYFKKGIKYLEGGVQSGFREVDRTKYTKRLFQCKGKHTVRVEQVELKCASLNQADVFILDDGPNMYVWIGPKSGRMERIKGIDIARDIRDDEKAGRSQIHIIETDWNSNAAFFKALGSKDKVIKAGDDKDDSEFIRKLDQETLLYRFFERDDGTVGATEIDQRPLRRDMLDSEFCYSLDSGYSGMFVWTGKKCSSDFKKKVWKAVNDLLNNRGYPSWMSVTRVVDGAETPLFEQYFADWDDDEYIPMPDQELTGDNVAEQSYESFDAEEMHEKAPDVQGFMPDDGSGNVQVWRVDNFELKPVPEHAFGVFFGGDSYVIQYDYQDKNGRDAHIIYFWQGLKSTVDERGTSALSAMKLDDDMGGQAVQIRIVMNKEPDHFLKIFKNKMIVFMGGHVTGFRNVKDHDHFKKDEPIMFHIRGDDEDHVRALQVECRGASLNTNDVFVVDTPKKCYVWYGKNSEANEKKMANYMLKHLSPEQGSAVEVQEGSESQQFWNAIGGEEPYFTGRKSKKARQVDPRLFHCSNSSGRFLVEEVVDFDQEDLVEDDVMILDTYSELFIWVGKGANEFEKKESYKTAYNYLASDPTGRTEDNTLILVVRQGFEPPQFTGHFHSWDTEKWSHGKTFSEILEEVGKENIGVSTLEDEAEKYTDTYSFDELKRKFPPEGVDIRKKEAYLSDEDFEKVFKMTKEEYYAKPQWKRIQLKKDVGLF